ncbi:MAG: WD40 repeat domain-containing protein [Pseudonocardiaceae bacterium]
MTGFGGAVYAAAFSPDGTILAFGGADYTVRLVDLTRPEDPISLDTPLIGPVGEVYEVAFNPDRNLLAISSIDQTIWLWDLHTPREPELLATLKAADGGLFTVAFSPDGHTRAAGGRDRAVRLWNTDLHSVAAWICTTAGDPITPSEWAQFIPDQPYTPPCR